MIGIIRDIESANPKLIVFINIWASWHLESDSEKLILDWFQQYWKKYYHVVGVVDMISFDNIVYRWNKDAANYSPESNLWLLILERTN